jgi:starch synthase (maltosyl-transferring)
VEVVTTEGTRSRADQGASQEVLGRAPGAASTAPPIGNGASGPGLAHIVVQDVRPSTPHGYPAKALVGEAVPVSASVFRDGHDVLAARALLRRGSEVVSTCALTARGNDVWTGTVVPSELGSHELVVEAWTDRYVLAGVRTSDLTASVPVPIWVERERAGVGAWYELFPRSFGGLRGAAGQVPRVAAMGFDILYLPPVHPIGRSFRKGKNNSLVTEPGDPGSPWAIGSEEGGHTSLHPDLGDFDDFDFLVQTATGHGVEVALDYALQCSPDHPWVKEHPEWFHHRPDGTIAYAENPPKKYQDIYPLNFWPAVEADRVALWEACKGIVDFWADRGIRIFRVDNPHTKPFAFWEWLIKALRRERPDLVLLAEAFTRPKLMARLAEIGFSQSYTYFTWRVGQYGPEGLRTYVEELADGPLSDYMRPNFWPNTPDILSGPLRGGPPSAFALRYILASTLSPSYGVYSGYELCENAPASPDNEEYLGSEKYEIKERDFSRPGSLAPLFTTMNSVRRRHPAFARMRNVYFHGSDNPNVIVYSKASDDGGDVVLVIVTVDPYATQEATLDLDAVALGVPPGGAFEVYDELSAETYTWGPHPYVKFEPWRRVAHVLDVRGRP